MIWFTSDEHYFHKNVIRYCNRPFKNIDEMKTTLIKRHNTVVKNDDLVYHIGDFAMVGSSQGDKLRGILEQLKGNHELILGNHDELKPQKYVDIGFQRVHTSLQLHYTQDREWELLELHHDPAVWCAIDRKHILIHGHIHTLYKSIPEKKCINVGVDQHDFYPISFENIKNELNL